MQHYCGRLRQENIIAQVEGDLHSTLYSEEKVNFNFEAYISIHRNVFNEMDKAKDCPSPDGGTRVRQLLVNITTRDPELATSIASVRASPTLRVDFEVTVDILCQAVRNNGRNNNSTRQISAIQRSQSNSRENQRYSRDRRNRNDNRRQNKNHKGGKPWKKNSLKSQLKTASILLENTRSLLTSRNRRWVGSEITVIINPAPIIFPILA